MGSVGYTEDFYGYCGIYRRFLWELWAIQKMSIGIVAYIYIQRVPIGICRGFLWEVWDIQRISMGIVGYTKDSYGRCATYR